MSKSTKVQSRKVEIKKADKPVVAVRKVKLDLGKSGGKNVSYTPTARCN